MAKRMILMLVVVGAILTALGTVKFKQIQTAIAVKAYPTAEPPIIAIGWRPKSAIPTGHPVVLARIRSTGA